MGHLCNYPHTPLHVSLPQPGPQEGTQRFVGCDAQMPLSVRPQSPLLRLPQMHSLLAGALKPENAPVPCPLAPKPGDVTLYGKKEKKK